MRKSGKVAILFLAIALSAGMLPDSGVHAAKPDPDDVPIYDLGPAGGGAVCSKLSYTISLFGNTYTCSFAFQFEGQCWYACSLE